VNVLLVPAHPGFPGQIPQSRKTVVVVVVWYLLTQVVLDKFQKSSKTVVSVFVCVPEIPLISGPDVSFMCTMLLYA